MISAGFALEEVKGQRLSLLPMQMPVQSTSPMVQPIRSSNVPRARIMPPAGNNPSNQMQNGNKTTKPPLEEEYKSADSALPHMVMSLLSLLLSMVWFVVIIPFKIGSMLFTFWVLVIVLRILWLFLANDNGAWEMGAGVDYEYNLPSIY